jgi:hypothetical protein
MSAIHSSPMEAGSLGPIGVAEMLNPYRGEAHSKDK